MLRVIGGKYRHRKLEQPPLEITRSTKDSAKEGLFNSLGLRINDSSFLDLFSGSGAIGIEAYSRGAKNVYLNDASSVAFKIIKSNLKSLDINDIQVTNLDYKEALNKFINRKINFDIIFLDPPYKLIIDLNFIEFLKNSGLLKGNWLIIIESDKDLDNDISLNYDVKKLKYGKSIMYIIKGKL